MYKKLQYFLLLFFFLFLFPANILAEDYFYDDFSTLNSDNWLVKKYDDDQIVVDAKNGIIKLDSTKNSFPYLVLKDKTLFPSNNSFLEIKFRFPDLDNDANGDGIMIGYTNPEQTYPYFQNSIWRGANRNVLITNNFELQKGNCKNFTGADETVRPELDINLDNQWHVYKVVYENLTLKTYFDENLIFTSTKGICVPENLVIGNYLIDRGSGLWNALEIDYVKISSLSQETKRNKIVVIPGMGASWSEEGVVLGLPANNWRMTPFVGNYNGLINSFKGVGLTENADFYVWNYDWRKPVESIKNDFNLFVNNNIGTSGKIDVVGHSLGGVVARVWAKENSDKAGKIISLGSPQQGALSAYDAWNGGKVSDKFDVAGVAFNILLQLHKNSKLTIAETVHEYSPVIKDLLPTFEYLYKNNNLTTPKVINNYLITQNQSVGSSVNFVTGKGVQTKFKINVGQQNLIQKVLNIWPDGEPVKYENGDGDGTVIVKSSRLGENSLEINSNHGDVVDKSINNVLTVLGLNTVPEISSENNLENKMVFYIGSPAKLNLICGDKTYESHDFIVASETNCTLKVIGESNGVYHLVYGYTNSEDSWGYIEGKTTSGLVSSWEVDIKNNKLILETDKNNTKDLLKYELNKAKIRYHENWLKLLLEVKGNAVAVGYIKEILMDTKGIDSKLMARLTYEKVSFGKKMVEMSLKDKKFEKLVTPTKALNVIEYQKTVKENEEAWNNKDYRKVWVTGMIADKYFIDIYQR